MQTEEYDKLFQLEDAYWWFVGRRALARRLLSAYAPHAVDVLDLGCGTGAGLAETPAGQSATGLDPEPRALDYCRRRGLSRLVLGDGARLPFRDRSFDAAVALDVYEHIEDDAAALRETARVLRPGGTLVLSVPAFRLLWGPHDVALRHFRRYRREEVVAKLRSAGLEPVRTSYAIHSLFPAVLVSRIVEKLRPGPPHASLPKVSPRLNQALTEVLRREADQIVDRGRDLPWGSSVVAVARRPDADVT